MNSLTALLHTQNDALRLGRCLETLYPCDEIVVVDHGSRDGTVAVAREYGARVVSEGAVATREGYLEATLSSGGAARAGRPRDSRPEAGPTWLLCLDPRESLTESLAASLYEWKAETVQDGVKAFSLYIREETAEGWIAVPAAQTRLVPGDWMRWAGTLPITEESAVVLEGELLRFVFP